MQPTTPPVAVLPSFSLAAVRCVCWGAGLPRRRPGLPPPVPAHHAGHGVSVGPGGERWIEPEGRRPRAASTSSRIRQPAGGRRPDPRIHRDRQGVIDMSDRFDHQPVAASRELNLFAALPDARLPRRWTLTQGRVGKGFVRGAREARRDPAGVGRERLPSCRTPSARWPPGRPGRAKFRVVGSPLYNETFAGQPHPDGLGRAQPALASGAVDGQENPLSGSSAPTAHRRPEAPDLWHCGRSADLRGERLGTADPGRPRGGEAEPPCGPAENVEKARKGIAGTDNAVPKQIVEAAGVTVTRLTPTAHRLRAFTRPV